MYISHMAIKTVSLKSEAYARLRSARRYPGAELLARCQADGAHFSAAELDALDALKAADAPAEDKWRMR
jgi:hypothetical protein